MFLCTYCCFIFHVYVCSVLSLYVTRFVNVFFIRWITDLCFLYFQILNDRFIYLIQREKAVCRRRGWSAPYLLSRGCTGGRTLASPRRIWNPIHGYGYGTGWTGERRFRLCCQRYLIISIAVFHFMISYVLVWNSILYYHWAPEFIQNDLKNEIFL